MNKLRGLTRLMYDWMGVLLVVCIAVLAMTGVWMPGSSDAMEASAALTDGGRLPVIVVDAGHGGPDGGAVTADGVPEAGINLTIAQLVENGLREAGFSVVMTRSDENALANSKQQDMHARREIMRMDSVNAIVSIHMNKFQDKSVSGPMAFYMKGSKEGEKLATCVISAVCETIGRQSRPANPGDYYVVRESIAPAVIIECGFLSNPEDARLLQDPEHQQKLADGIVAGLCAYFASP
ncbi:N-acetylmuramoyl-L-alanine amidase [Eubacteriales bacterium OttesenSCG-928-K08]|nr:N-acetylmuramoyl-L-alanine amidase [Eubacteriales bacterium OttesenSCG-928-K08]